MDAIAQLRLLLEAAAEQDGDAATGAALREAAHDATTALAETGLLPPHLTVSRDEPLVAVIRMLAMAWQHVTTPSQVASSSRHAEWTLPGWGLVRRTDGDAQAV